MIAIAKIGGHQELVRIGDMLEVDKINAEVGQTVVLSALLISEEDGSGFKIGTPFLEDEKIVANVVEHGKGDKIRVYKMKAKKRYRRTIGHRQEFSVIEILTIAGKGAEKKTIETKEAPTSIKEVDEKEETAV